MAFAEDLRAIERRERQLWLLAFFFIFLLAVSVFLVDAASSRGGRRRWARCARCWRTR